jgi:hypothetical protein
VNLEFVKHENDLIFSSVGGHKKNKHYNSKIESDAPKDMSIGGTNL